MGAAILGWLGAGESVATCESRAGVMAGESVDVHGFLHTLLDVGILLELGHGRDVDSLRSRPVKRVWRNLGNALFNRAAWLLYISLTLVATAVIVGNPDLRPRFTDALIFDSPLASFLIGTLLFCVFGMLHEMAHFLAAAKLGLKSSISISRRMYIVVFQTDLTRLWTVDRRRRIAPILAGMTVDGAILGILLLSEAGLREKLPVSVVGLIRLAVFLKVGGLVAQTAAYMRTDLYALYLVLSGCKNLWLTKGALLRQMLRTATNEDLAHLAIVSRSEVRWARIYLVLYVPGFIYAAWYIVFLGLPAGVNLIETAVRQIIASGLLSLSGLGNLLMLAIILASMVYGVGGAAITIIRVISRRIWSLRRAGMS